ncbi:MAG: hypothetical protein E7644_08780 [Ruminococcaceae bacterium]|nr:hypothetical protein [Oscillospiraceae bacterium]
MAKHKRTDFASKLISCILFALLLPFLLLLLVGMVLYLPVDYIKFKRSRYQKDFPRKYSPWCGCHIDNEIYTLVQEHELPMTYVKPHVGDDYAQPGYFLYQNVLLYLCPPLDSFLFDEKKDEWLFDPGMPETDESEEIEEIDEENTDHCLTPKEAAAWYLAEFARDTGSHACDRVMFFCERERLEADCSRAAAIAQLAAEEGVILYGKGKLVDALRDMTEKT